MQSIVNFVVGLFQLAFILAIILAFLALLNYNKLRGLSEVIKEAWSNIGVVGRKQASVVNQLIDVVKSYQESEKLVMLKVSEDMSNAASVAQMYQQSGMVLSSVNGLADKFPELKANQQYQRLIDSIQACETQLETARSTYNGAVRKYNTARSKIPTILYAPVLGFKAAPYLEFTGHAIAQDMGALNSFSPDDDGERLNALIGKAGGKLLEVSGKTLEAGKVAAQKAVEGGKVLADKAQDKLDDMRAERQGKPDAAPAAIACPQCAAPMAAQSAFCSACGARRVS